MKIYISFIPIFIININFYCQTHHFIIHSLINTLNFALDKKFAKILLLVILDLWKLLKTKNNEFYLFFYSKNFPLINNTFIQNSTKTVNSDTKPILWFLFLSLNLFFSNLLQSYFYMLFPFPNILKTIWNFIQNKIIKNNSFKKWK